MICEWNIALFGGNVKILIVSIPDLTIVANSTKVTMLFIFQCFVIDIHLVILYTLLVVSCKIVRNIINKKYLLQNNMFSHQDKVPEVSFLRVLALNRSEWYLILFACIAALGNGAIQPAFAIVFSEILGVSLFICIFLIFCVNKVKDQHKRI